MPSARAPWLLLPLAAILAAAADARAQGAAERRASDAGPTAHWAFRPLSTAEPPQLEGVPHPIDRFVVAELRRRGIEPAPVADPATLLRRTALALTGLPPSPAEVDAFVADPSPAAFERLVDGMLGSIAHAEHVASRWLDLARYADTHGYEVDGPRTQWPWRDELIRSLARDEPFDVFTVRQLAGDLLPDATLDDVVASAFHRNAMLTEEAGSDPEEFRVVAVQDRVDATARTWLGLSLDCARCHDHPNDPITQREYYAFQAFFDSTADRGDQPGPTVTVPPPEARARLDARRAELRELEARLAGAVDAERSGLLAWIETEAERERAAHRAAPEFGPWHQLGPIATGDARQGFARPFAPERGVDLSAAVHGARFVRTPELVLAREHRIDAEHGVVYLSCSVRGLAGAETGFTLTTDAAVKVFFAGREVAARPKPDPAPLAVTLRTSGGDDALLIKLAIVGPAATFRLARQRGAWPDDLADALLVPTSARDAATTAALLAHARDHAPLTATLRGSIAALRDELATVPGTPLMVMRELDQPRSTRVLERGDWLRPGAVVTPETPACLPPFPADAPRDRLGLARWIVDPANPLMPRVAVNRVWAALFGAGLVATPDDFGRAGAAPAHAELLDWLARRFVADGYSLRRLHRSIVTSTTWQRSSASDAAAGTVGPDGVFAGRGPRYRLRFEQLRDQALAAAGLLDRTVGGPSVMPPQPPDVWERSYAYDPDHRWVESPAPARHRRGLYIYLRRTAPYPTWTLFDGPRRDVCATARQHTDTPLQTLALWNDPVFVEAAGGLARRARTEAGPHDAARLERLWRLVLARQPDDPERAELAALLAAARAAFAADPDAARELCRSARIDTADTLPAAEELAAWIAVANTVLSLDETVRLR